MLCACIHKRQYGFTIDPPTGWTVEEPSYAAVAFLGPIDQGFRANVNIQVEPTSLSLEQYISTSKQSLQTLDDFTLISEESRVIKQVDAYELVFTFTYSGSTVQEKQVYLVKNGKAFIITYAAVPTTYQNHLTTFENSVQTFTIHEPTTKTFLGLDWWLWVVIIVVVVVVAATTVLILRKRKPPVTPSPQQPQLPPAQPPVT
jgi:hypothetical protein